MAFPQLLCVLLLSYCSAALAGRFAVVPSSSFQPAVACSMPRVASEPNRATVPLVHRHGPCAPSRSNSNHKPSLAERLSADRARAAYITSMASGSGRVATAPSSGPGVSIPTYLGSSVDSLEYVVTVSLGTPAVPQVLLIDTGSDLSWVQCQPCNSTQCYPQNDPLFDPTKSSTYAPIPCKADACKQLSADGYDNGCTNDGDLCGYGIQYGDGSTTTGVYSTETMALKPGVSIRSFGFGCGSDQHGPNDRFDGLLGLGGAPESLVAQTSSVYGGAFSYCLPPVNGSAGFLSLGAPPRGNNTAGFLFTPMRGLPGVATFYVVTLAGISVGGKPLDVPPSVFASGMIIDSGSVLTALPATAYAALTTAFRSAMSQYPLLPPSPDRLDTCYNFTGISNVTVPKVAMAFSGGATIDLDVASGVLLDGCLAFVGAGRDDITGIIGNVNQRTFEVSYDTAARKVGFRAGAC